MRTRRLVVTFDIEIDIEGKCAEWTAEEIAGSLLELQYSGPIFAYKVNGRHAEELSL